MARAMGIGITLDNVDTLLAHAERRVEAAATGQEAAAIVREYRVALAVEMVNLEAEEITAAAAEVGGDG